MNIPLFLAVLCVVAAAKGSDQSVNLSSKPVPSEAALTRLSSKITSLTAIQGRTPNQEERLLRMQFAEALFQTVAEARTPEERIRLVDELINSNPEIVKELNPHSSTK